MGQPGDPYQQQGYGGQQPWGHAPSGDPWTAPPPAGPSPSWQQPAQSSTPSWSPPPDPWHHAAPTGSSGWQSPPPPPSKSNTGLIVGLISGAAVLLLIAAAIGLFVYRDKERQNPVANPSHPSSSSPSASPTASPSPSGTDPGSLDSADTDKTRLTTTAIFPDTTFTGDSGEEYTLAGTLDTTCTRVGSGKARSVMKKYDCDTMLVGVYLTSDEDLFTALLVIPFSDKSEAEDVHSDLIADKQDVINALTYYCPSDGNPGAKLCKRSADNLPTWYASFSTFHRYVFIAISLYTDGHRTEDLSEVDDVTADIGGYVSEVLLGERE